MLDRQEDVHVIAGSIFGPGETEKVVPKKNIFVPPMLYEILVVEPKASLPERTLAFHFPHYRVAHGDIQDFLTSVYVIEAMSGVGFFRTLDINEDPDSHEMWKEFFQGS